MRLFLRIIGFLMLGFLFIALILYINGVNHVDFDNRYYSFLLDVNKKLSDWAVLEVPKIPEISMVEEELKVGNVDFAGFVNGFYTFVNFIIGFLNFIVMLFNEILKLLKFIVAIIVVLVEDIPAIFKPSTQNTPVVSNTNFIL